MLKFLYVLMFCILFANSSSNAIADASHTEKSGVIDLFSAPESYMEFFYAPTYEQAKEFLYKDVGNNPVLYDNLVLCIGRYGVLWQGIVSFYSIEKQEFMFSKITDPLYGDISGIYGWVDTFVSQEPCSSAEERIRFTNATREWEFEYGPVFDWPVEIKYLYYDKYNCMALMPDHDYDPSIKWALPNEDNKIEDVLFEVHKMIQDIYQFDVSKQDHIHECVEFLGRSHDKDIPGQWSITYWIKIKTGEKIVWSMLMKFQQTWEGDFVQLNGVDPSYMDFFIR